VLANLKQAVKDKPVRIHPIVSQLVDPAVLEKMKVRPVGAAEARQRETLEALVANKGKSAAAAAKDGSSVQPSRRPGVERAAGADAAAPQMPQPQTPTGAAPAQISPEMRGRIAELRNRVQLNTGQVVLAMMNLPRYRSQTLGDLTHLVLDPMMRDRLAIAHRAVEGKPEGEVDVAGIAIWASVSDAVDAKITEQVKAGVFPVRLANEDWTSGDKVWLLDVIAGDRKAATAVLANFRQLSGERAVKIHPIVARMIDPDVLEKLKARPAAAETAQGALAKAETKGSA
jgi:cytolysin-activating lysine-acyltransferase